MCLVVVSCVVFSNTAVLENVSGATVTSLAGLVGVFDVIEVTGSMLIVVLSETVVLEAGLGVFFCVVLSVVVIGSDVVFSCARVLRTLFKKEKDSQFNDQLKFFSHLVISLFSIVKRVLPVVGIPAEVNVNGPVVGLAVVVVRQG